ncbi:MAG: LmbE family N-acetylglucosaminyl deacetylase [Cyclobacteriaceae bacterium]|jgi:LmbE family N-acetylglucosaminyl deacetylase
METYPSGIVYNKQNNSTMKRIISFGFFFSLLSISSFAQDKNFYKPGEIYAKLQQLNTVGSVLYVAAHPDDENTQLITYFAKGKHLRTGYLSATRGDGGQNLIGIEIKEELGVIRTQELLRARRIDGGQQFFSRATDFGYSKHPDETFNVWDKEKVLADFIWVYRNFRPDIIITRFSQEPGVTHGHHTASAILGMEAFDMAGDSTVLKEQLNLVEPWAPQKILWNIGLWSYRRSGEKFDPEGFSVLDVGRYDPLLGESYTEIAARSRSSHKSQGFGQSGSRGSENEYLKQWGGIETDDLFEGLDLTWNRIENAEYVQSAIDKCLNNFDAQNPSSIIPYLIEGRKALLKLPDQYWKDIKMNEIDQLIVAAAGLYLEARTDKIYFTKGDSIKVEIEAVNRSDYPIILTSIDMSLQDELINEAVLLQSNKSHIQEFQFAIPENTNISQPYWLKKKGTLGMYNVSDLKRIGKPENDPLFSARISLKIDDQYIDQVLPIVYKTTDRVKGEVSQPIVMTPEVMVNIETKSLVFGNEEPKTVSVRVTSGKENISGELKLMLPKGWKSKPLSQPFASKIRNEEKVYSFLVTPPKRSSKGQLRVEAVTEMGTFDKGITKISYDHIPNQVIFPEAILDVTKIDLKIMGTEIGYVMGAGDQVPEALMQIGYNVTLLEKDDIVLDNLKLFDAVVVGIRAFNVNDWMAFKNQELFEYAKLGGTVVVQYNTYGTVTDKLAPYPLKISRDRVSVEEAPVEIIDTAHPVVNRPNKILKQDFENWVQERGLYFPNEWSAEFKPILKMNDPGEDEKLGSLLIAPYGNGYYVYTGLSFFRELPAGVPGAYKLLANILSLKQTSN